MREDQIIRYGRQILLRDVGGRGQERLLAAPIRVLGGGADSDDAIAWLLAGGTPIELPAGVMLTGGYLDGLTLERPQQPAVAELVPRGFDSGAPLQVVLGAGVAFRSAGACQRCWETVRSSLNGLPTGGPLGALAALTLQRLVLGWADPMGIVHWDGERLKPGPIPVCPHR